MTLFSHIPKVNVQLPSHMRKTEITWQKDSRYVPLLQQYFTANT